MNWQLISIVGDVVIFLLSALGALVAAFFTLVFVGFLYDVRQRRRERKEVQEPITQVRITVPRRQDVPEVYYKAFEEE